MKTNVGRMLGVLGLCVACLGLLLAFVVPARAAQADRFVPGDAEQVVVINVKQILSSALGRKYALPKIEKLKENKQFNYFRTFTGLDLTKDVNTIVLSNAGVSGDKAIVIVRGRFNLDKIVIVAEVLAKVEKDVFKIGKISDRPLYEGIMDRDSFFFTFIDGTTMIGSTSKDYLTAAVQGNAGKMNKDLAAVLATVDARQSIWVAGLVTEDAKKLLVIVQQDGLVETLLKALLKKIKSGGGGVTISDSITFTASASTGDPEAAKEVVEALYTARNLLALIAEINEMIKPFADEVLKTLAIKRDKGNVSVSFKLSEDIIKKAAELIPNQ